MSSKKKKKKLNLRKLIVLVLLIYIIGFGIYYLFREPIRNIIITGNDIVLDSEIIEQAGIKDYPSIFSLNKSKLKKKINKIELIKDVEIKRNIKFQLKINVIEKKIICIYDNKLLLDDGNRIENKNYERLIPTLVNNVPEDTLNKFLEKMGNLSYDILSLISEIEYSPTMDEKGTIIDESRFIFRMNDGIVVYINTSRINAMNKYHKIYASLDDKKGILHLDSGDYLEVKQDELQPGNDENNPTTTKKQ